MRPRYPRRRLRRTARKATPCTPTQTRARSAPWRRGSRKPARWASRTRTRCGSPPPRRRGSRRSAPCSAARSTTTASASSPTTRAGRGASWVRTRTLRPCSTGASWSARCGSRGRHAVVLGCVGRILREPGARQPARRLRVAAERGDRWTRAAARATRSARPGAGRGRGPAACPLGGVRSPGHGGRGVALWCVTLARVHPLRAARRGVGGDAPGAVRRLKGEVGGRVGVCARGPARREEERPSRERIVELVADRLHRGPEHAGREAGPDVREVVSRRTPA